MGYSTNFEGVLKFKNDITVWQLNYLKNFLGEDCRNHPEWEVNKGGTRNKFTWIDYKITDDLLGLEWNGSEKSYDMAEKINLITYEMRKKFPEFYLEGELIAQGDDWDDRWKLVIDEDGYAKRVDIEIKGIKVKCPHCDEYFVLEE